MRAAANAVRGEVLATLAGGMRRLCLTLGALAEIEEALGVEGLEALAARMRKLSARDIAAVLGALLRGGGEVELADELPRTGVDTREAVEAIVRAFKAAA